MLLLKGRRQGNDLLALGPGGLLAARSRTGLQVWVDFHSAAKPVVFHEIRATASIQFTPDGRTLVFEGGEAGTIDLATNEVRFFPEPEGYRFQRLVCEGTCLLEVDLPSGRKANSFARRPLGDGFARKNHDWKVRLKRHFAGRPIEVVGDRFVVQEGQGVHDGGRRFYYTLRNGLNGEKLSETPMLDWISESDAVSADGKWLAGQHTNQIRVWDLTDFTAPPVERATGSRKIFTDLVFHPSSRWLVASSTDGTVKFFDTASWAVAHTFSWGIGKMVGVAFSPDGQLAAAGSDQGRIMIWDVDL